MSTDQELLELAAKAVGLDASQAHWHERAGLVWVDRIPGKLRNERCWNPLTDDGDALRLAVKLGFSVGNANAGPKNPDWSYAYAGIVQVPHDGLDPYAATRRAIVMAAAKLGKEMP